MRFPSAISSAELSPQDIPGFTPRWAAPAPRNPGLRIFELLSRFQTVGASGTAITWRLIPPIPRSPCRRMYLRKAPPSRPRQPVGLKRGPLLLLPLVFDETAFDRRQPSALSTPPILDADALGTG